MADDLHDPIRDRLAAIDQRYTTGRRRLIELLLEIGGPATLPELSATDPGLPTSSMYRNLEVLERAGVVHRITTGSNHAHFELAEPLVGHHHHLICTSCGNVEDVELDADFEALVDRTLAATASATGFVPDHHTLDLHGRCAACVAADADADAGERSR